MNPLPMTETAIRLRRHYIIEFCKVTNSKPSIVAAKLLDPDSIIKYEIAYISVYDGSLKTMAEFLGCNEVTITRALTASGYKGFKDFEKHLKRKYAKMQQSRLQEKIHSNKIPSEVLRQPRV